MWSDWVGTPLAEVARGVRLDTSYYYWPGSWIQDRAGLFTGSGFPMRFANTDGSLIDVFQAATQLTDESQQNIDAEARILLDNAIGANGYYAVITANMHTDNADSPGADDIIADAQARGVPVVSARQMLTWLDGRDQSSFAGLSFAGGRLSSRSTRAPARAACRRCCRSRVPTGTLLGLARNGANVPFGVQSIKGIDYAMFDAAAGSYVATYPAPAGSPPGTTPPTGGTGAQQDAEGQDRWRSSSARRSRRPSRG